MSTIEFVKAYIHRLCKDIGTSADAIYNAKTCAWYFSRGSSTIEVFLTNIDSTLRKQAALLYVALLLFIRYQPTR